MEAAGGDTQFSFQHSQSGCISAVQGKRNGGDTSEIRVRCDCPPQTLLATLAHSLVEASCAGMAGRGFESAESDAEVEEADEPVLLAQIGECRHRIRAARSVAAGGAPAFIQLLSGRIFLRGDIVLVSGGRAFYSENSHLWMLPLPASSTPGQKVGNSSSAPPTFSGAMAQRSDLFACVGDDLDGACLFYDAERSQLQLGSRQTILQRPLLQLGGRQFRLDLLARQLSHFDRVRPATTKDLPSAEAASTAASAFLKSSAQRQSLTSINLDLDATNQLGGDNLAPVRTLLLLGGRCMLHSDTMLVLSGLLHFAGSWHRVQTACSGSGFQQAIPRLTGTSLLKRRRRKNSSIKQRHDDEVAAEIAEAASTSPAAGSDRPLLLNNVWLYAQGGSVFMGGSAVLTGAHLAMSADLRPVSLDQQERMLARLPTAIRRQVPCRLFLQSGRFCVSSGSCSLLAVAGVAWLRGRKASLGAGSGDQLLIRDAVAFLTQRPGAGNGSGDSGGHWVEGRDLLYKDGLLYLDDLTPVLMGGRICIGQQEMKLEWLSGWGDDPKAPADDNDKNEYNLLSDTGSAGEQSDSVDQPVGMEMAETSTDIGERDLVTDCICLLESGGRSLHILRGRMRLTANEPPGKNGETVLVDRGVAYFAAESTRPTRLTAAFPPPRIFGRPLMPRPSESARQCATSVDRQSDSATFEEARLSLSRGTLWLNGEVPLLKGCRLLLNGQIYDLQNPSMPVMPMERNKASESSSLIDLLKLQQIPQSDQVDSQQSKQQQGASPESEQQGLAETKLQQQQQLAKVPGDGHQQLLLKTSSIHGFIGGYSVVANRQTEALIFSLKARFPDGLQFLFEAA